VSLQGSLETFALPDVLVLLSSTKKDGELHVVGGRVDGRVWLEKGEIVHCAIGAKEFGPVDSIFELLRLQDGTFSFESDIEPPKRAEPQTIDAVLADAQIRLSEWQEVAKVVPHLDAIVDMADDAPDDEVSVTRDHWHLLRSVAGGRSVHDVMDKLGLSEFDTCKQVKELVDARLATIDVHAKAPAKREAAAKAPEAPAPARSKPAESRSDAEDDRPRADDKRPEPRTAQARRDPEPVAARPESQLRPEPEVEVEVERELAKPARAEHLASGGELPEVADGDEPINRGLLLKFLSSVRN